MIPQFPHSHPVFDEWPIKQNYPCPLSASRLRTYQRQIDRIAGRASNGKSNVRVIWTSDPAVAMHIINGEEKARYAIRTDSYRCTKTVDSLEVVEDVDVDICAPRFVFEQYHTPEEQEFNPAPPDVNSDNQGYYTHLFTVGFHDETCCAGREAANGSICLGAYQEPSDTHLDYLRMLIRLRNEQKQVRMIGDPITAAELAEDYRRVKSWGEQRDVLTRQGFASVALDSLQLHGCRSINTDGGKRSKFQFLNDGLVKGIHY